MSTEQFKDATRRGAPKRPLKPYRSDEPSGPRATGRIVTILVGRGDGFIRLANERKIYFHRADLQEGTSFHDLQIGDVVQFELLEDSVSGARALKVMRPKRTR
jgi:cold shock CspA family protein